MRPHEARETETTSNPGNDAYRLSGPLAGDVSPHHSLAFWREAHEIDAATVADRIRSVRVSSTSEVVVDGMRISGALDLSRTVLPFPIRFVRCLFTDTFRVASAELGSLTIQDSIVPFVDATHARFTESLVLDRCATIAIDLHRVHVGSDLMIRDTRLDDIRPLLVPPRFGRDAQSLGGTLPCTLRCDDLTVAGDTRFESLAATGPCYLRDARLGNLAIIGGTVGDGQRSLIGTRMQTTGTVNVGHGFEARGRMNLSNATVGGSLSFTRVRLRGAGDASLVAERLKVASSLSLVDFEATGAVVTAHAVVGSSVNVARASFCGETFALLAERCTIGGSLDARRGLRAHGTVSFGGARVRGSVLLDGAKLAGAGGQIPLNLEGIDVGDDVSLARSVSTGGLRLTASRIGGRLVLTGAELSSPQGDALHGEGINVAGSLVATAIRAQGHVALSRARIGGQLVMRDAILRNPGRTAVSLDSAHVEAGAILDGGFRSLGQVRLLDARIGGMLALNGAHLSHRGDAAFVGDRMEISGPFFCAGLTSRGSIRVLGASIQGQVSFRGAKLDGFEGHALAGDSMQCSSDMFCENMRCDGGLRLLSATVGGRIALNDASLRAIGRPALELRQAKVSGELTLRGVRFFGDASLVDFDAGRTVSFQSSYLAPGSTLDLRRAQAPRMVMSEDASIATTTDLRDAKVSTYVDTERGWSDTLRLDGFRFEDFDTATSTAMRLRWIRRAGSAQPFLPRPYDQVAHVHRQGGRAAAARVTLIARERDRRPLLSGRGKLWSRLLDLSVGYGYEPWKALWSIGALLILGTVVFKVGHDHDGLVAVRKGTQPFDATLYSLDRLVPVFTIGVRDNLAPRGWVRYVSGAYALTGWVLTTAIVAGLSNAVRRD